MEKNNQQPITSSSYNVLAQANNMSGAAFSSMQPSHDLGSFTAENESSEIPSPKDGHVLFEPKKDQKNPQSQNYVLNYENSVDQESPYHARFSTIPAPSDSNNYGQNEYQTNALQLNKNRLQSAGPAIQHDKLNQNQISRGRAVSIKAQPTPMLTEPSSQSPMAGKSDSFRMEPQYENSFHSARDKQVTSIPLAEYILTNKGSNAIRNSKALNRIIESQHLVNQQKQGQVKRRRIKTSASQKVLQTNPYQREAVFLDRLGLAMKQGANSPAQLRLSSRGGETSRSPGSRPTRISKKQSRDQFVHRIKNIDQAMANSVGRHQMLRFLIGKKKSQIQSVYAKLLQSKSELQTSPQGNLKQRENYLQELAQAISGFEAELGSYEQQLGQEIGLYDRLIKDRSELIYMSKAQAKRKDQMINAKQRYVHEVQQIKQLKGDIKKRQYLNKMSKFDNARRENQEHVEEARMHNYFHKFDKDKDPSIIGQFIKSAQRQEDTAIDAIAKRSVQPSGLSQAVSVNTSFQDDLSVPPGRDRRSVQSIPVLSPQTDELHPNQAQSHASLRVDQQKDEEEEYSFDKDFEESKRHPDIVISGPPNEPEVVKRPQTTTQAEKHSRQNSNMGFISFRQDDQRIQPAVTRTHSQPGVLGTQRTQRSSRNITPHRQALTNYPRMLQRAGRSLQSLTEKNMYWDPSIKPMSFNDKVLDRLMQQQTLANREYVKKKRQAAKAKKLQEEQRQQLEAVKKMQIIVLPGEIPQAGRLNSKRQQRGRVKEVQAMSVDHDVSGFDARKTNHSALSNLEKNSDEENYKTGQKHDSAVDGRNQNQSSTVDPSYD